LWGSIFRVQDGQLYGVGNGGGIYTIDTYTAVATLVQNLTVGLDGYFFGFDFNPAAQSPRPGMFLLSCAFLSFEFRVLNAFSVQQRKPGNIKKDKFRVYRFSS
jgi:hypothetical protein